MDLNSIGRFLTSIKKKYSRKKLLNEKKGRWFITPSYRWYNLNGWHHIVGCDGDENQNDDNIKMS